MHARIKSMFCFLDQEVLGTDKQRVEWYEMTNPEKIMNISWDADPDIIYLQPSNIN